MRHTLLLLLTILLSACATQNRVAYLQDIQAGVPVAMQEVKEIKLQPGDRLRVLIFSRDRELADMFNLVRNTSTNDNATAQYTVSADGQIDIPVLGQLDVAGLTRQEVADLVKYRLLSAKLLRDPVVNVEYSGIGCSVIGEVAHPGRVDFQKDHVSLVEALAQAGDLTINGRRDNVLVLRTVDGVQTPYRIDLTSTASLYASPAYWLRQDDVVYIEPNQRRTGDATLNANLVRSPSFWFSAASMLMTIIVFIAK